MLDSWSICNCSLCVSVKDTLFIIYHWFINIGFTVSSTITHAWTRLTSHTLSFYMKHITAFSPLATLDSTSALCLGAILNGNIASQKDKNAKNSSKETIKKTLLTVWELKQEQSVSLFDLSWEPMRPMIQIFHCSAHVCKWPQKHHKYWFWAYK